MAVAWLFEVNTYKLSTKAITYGVNTYSAKIIPESFRGITMKWDISGHLMSPGQLTFEISNVDGAIGRSDLEGYDLLVWRVVPGVQSRSWKFTIQRAVPYYGKMKCYCVDFLKAYLDGQWPNTPHPKEVWPSDDTDPDDLDDACIPVVFGEAFIPIMSVNTGADRFYVLGDDDTDTYSIEEVRAPREIGVDLSYDAASYTFNQFNVDGRKLAQFIIDDSDGDGVADDNGLWESGSGFYPPLVRLERLSTFDLEYLDQWLEYILEDFGVPSANIDTGSGSTFAAAHVVYFNRGQQLKGGYWRRKNRERVLVELLRMCDSFLVVTNKIELHPFSATPIETIDKSDVKKLSYSPSPLTQSPHDGGRVSWPEAGKPQDKLIGKAIVPLYEAQATISAPSGEVFEYAYGQDSADAQRAAILHFAKKYLQKDRITLKTSCNKITNIDTLLPGQVLTLDDAIFGASFDLIIESLSIAPDDTVSITGVRLSHVEDWSDISTLEITVTGDSSSGWRVAVLRSDGVVDADVNWSRIQDDDGHRPDPDADVTSQNTANNTYVRSLKDIDTSQADFQAGALTDVEADAGGYLRLADTDVLSFDGVDDYVDCGNAAVFDITSAITLEVWFKTTDTTAGEFLVNKEASSDNGYFLYGLRQNSVNTFSLHLNLVNAGVQFAATLNAYNDGNWHHLAGTFDGRYIKVYIDGILDATADLGTTDTIKTNSYNYTIGRSYVGVSTRYFAGSLCENRLWNVVRTQTEIQDNMNKRLTGTEPGLVAYYNIDEGTGSIAIDSAGANDGTINGVTWVANEPLYFMNPAGDNNRRSPQLDLSAVGMVESSQLNYTAIEDVLSFDGVDDAVSLGVVSEANFTNDPWTVEFWSKVGSSPNNNSRVLSFGSYSTAGWEIFDDDEIEVRTYDGTSHSQTVNLTNPTNWHHVAWARAADGTSKIYINGILESSVTLADPVSYTNDCYIGKYTSAGYEFQGNLADIRVWNVIRTQTEIQDNMNKRLTGTELGLVAYYPMYEGVGTTVFDKAGSNDGTITGATWITDNSLYFDTTIIETRVSSDNGATWTAWKACTNGEVIPDLPYGTDVSTALLECRQSLSTSDPTVTPRLESITVTVNGDSYRSVAEAGADVTGNHSGDVDALQTQNAPAEAGADVTNYTDTRVANALNQDSVLTIQRPGGATYNGVSGETGAIKITLPQSWTSTMLRFMVHVYDYNLDLSFTLVLGGFAQSSGSQWLSTFAQLIGNKGADNAVRFGHDGTKCCVIIGETASTWNYLKVTVQDFQAGYTNYSVDQWDDGWSISLITTLPAQIDKTYSNSLLDANAVKTLVGSDLEPAEAGAVKNFSSLADDGGTLSIANSVLRVLGADGLQLEPGADLFIDSESGNQGTIYFLTASGRYVKLYADYANDKLYIEPSTDLMGTGLSLGGSNKFTFISVAAQDIQMDATDNGNIWLLCYNQYSQQSDLLIGATGIDIGGAAGSAGPLTVHTGLSFNSSGDKIDDYEEGVYTVTCTPATSGTITLESTRDVLRYQKVGNWCHVQGSVRVISTSSPVGEVGFSLPFTIANDTETSDEVVGSLGIWAVAVDAGCLWMNTMVKPNSANKAFMVQNRDNNVQYLYGDKTAQLASGSILYLDFTYKTA